MILTSQQKNEITFFEYFIKKSLFAIIVCFTSILANAQQNVKLPDILPPSPSSFPLTRYGGINLGLQTGTAQYNIPIYTLTARKLSLALSLSYSTNGIKVDEIASRAGMSWILNAGGLITRTVYDQPDETSTRLIPPANFAHNAELYSFLEKASISQSTKVDIAPDFFSFNFNGYSGQFIINNNKIVQLTKTNLRIEFNQLGQNAFEGRFRITTPDGVMYYFGGGPNSVETSYNTAIGENCGKGYVSPIENAWYLTKVVHPEGDNITLSYLALASYTYPASISQSKTRSINGVPYCAAAGTIIIDDTNCENIITTNAVYLSRITTSDNNYIDFKYTKRQDLIYDNLIESINVFEDGNPSSYLKSFSFKYEYAIASSTFQNQYAIGNNQLSIRPFLISVTESGQGINEQHNYKFGYNNASLLPPRLSYAQDDFGYFNGKNNNGLIPTPAKFLVSFFPDANADRTSSFEYAKAGTLNKITYPTGGYDSIAYKAPVYTVTELPDPVDQTLSASTSGANLSTPVTVTSDPIVVTSAQTATIGSSFLFAGNPEDQDFHAQSYIYLINNTTGQMVYTRLINTEDAGGVDIIDLIQGNTYVIRCTSYGKYSIGSGVLHYYTQGNVPEIKNKVTGGVVVDFVKTYDPVKNVSLFKKYFYSKLQDLTTSSGLVSLPPVYMSDYSIRFKCSTQTFDCGSVFSFKSMYSNSLTNLYEYSQHHIYFQNVVESFGLNFDNGGIEHTYMVEADAPGEILLGNNILGSKLSNRGIGINGLETLNNTFIKNGNAFQSLQQVKTTYKVEDRLGEILYGYTIRKRYNNFCISSPPIEDMFGAYDLNKNYIYTRWIYPETVETTRFEGATSNAIVQTETTAYENIADLQPTKITRIDSKGNSLEKTISYSAEMIAHNQDPSGVYSAMLNKNIINIPIQTLESKNSNILSLYRTNYAVTPFGHYLPSTIETQINQDKLETRINFSTYDDRGNLLFVLKENSQKSVYIWSYNKTYPIAEIKNADYSTVQQLLGGKAAVDNFANKFHPTVQEISAFIAPLKTMMPDSHIVILSYRPLVGITNRIEPNGLTTSYEYDGFQRLRSVKDQNGNIVKTYNYYFKP